MGIAFTGEEGEWFFRSSLVQTLFYGVFSAWVLWARHASESDEFDWRLASWTLNVPMVRTLFQQLASPTLLAPTGLSDVLDWTGHALNRVDRSAFFEQFDHQHAVQHFYEPFLEQFDPELRKQLGVCIPRPKSSPTWSNASTMFSGPTSAWRTDWRMRVSMCLIQPRALART